MLRYIVLCCVALCGVLCRALVLWPGFDCGVWADTLQDAQTSRSGAQHHVAVSLVLALHHTHPAAREERTKENKKTGPGRQYLFSRGPRCKPHPPQAGPFVGILEKLGGLAVLTSAQCCRTSGCPARIQRRSPELASIVQHTTTHAP